MRLDELSPGAQKVVRWMKRHAKEPCRSHSQLVTETGEAATAVSEALGFLSSERKLYSATDPDPVRANGFIRAYGGDTIFYRYCADPEAFDARSGNSGLRITAQARKNGGRYGRGARQN